MATRTNEPNLTKRQLVEVVRTGTTTRGVGKMRALAMLRSKRRRDTRDLMMEVISTRGEQHRFRQMATMGLYELGGQQADGALAEAAQHADARLAGTIAVGLGRVGSAQRLPIIEELGGIAEPYRHGQVAFAASLLAYRHGLDGQEIRFPSSRQLQQLGRRKANEIKILEASAEDAELAAAALKIQPLEVDLTSAGALDIDCNPNRFVWMWNSKVAQGELSALDQKSVAAVLFRRSRFEKRYALSALALATPGRGGVRLTVHRVETGQMLFAGSISRDGALELRARRQPGVSAIDVQARVTGTQVEVAKAKSAAVALEARNPKAA